MCCNCRPRPFTGLSEPMHAARLLLFAILCIGLCIAALAAEKVSVDQVKAMIAGGLSTGANRQEIEAFLIRHNLPYSFDRFQNRYQSIIRDAPGKATDRAIVIYINLDESGRFASSEIRESFTMP